MKLQKYFPWLKEAWNSYLPCRSTLWWPLSYLILSPLAAIILFGAIIPLGFHQLGWISFDHAFLNYTYILLVSGLVFIALFPFLDGLYRLIKKQLDGDVFDENTGFNNLKNSKSMGISMGPAFLGIIIFQLLGTTFLPFKLMALAVYLFAVFTPIISVSDAEVSWYKAKESILFALSNKKLLLQVWGMRFLILLALLLPWLLVAFTGNHSALKVFVILVAIPGFIYTVVKVLPFYFYYPAYVHKQTVEKGQ